MLIWKNKYGYELYEDKFEKSTCGYVRHKNGYVAILAEENNKVYLVKSYRYPIRKNLIEIPKGYIETGEKPLAAAKRELREETGLTAKKWTQLGTFYMVPGFMDMKCYLFLAKDLKRKKAKKQDDEKDLRVIVVDKKDISKSKEAITRLAFLLSNHPF